MTKTWKLNRTVQCAKCPWRVGTDPHGIPNGYSVEKHRNLKGTIAEPGLGSLLSGTRRAMACHEEHAAHCIGWLMHQMGPGNNIALRMQMMRCENFKDVQLIGEQHKCFEDTLPQEVD